MQAIHLNQEAKVLVRSGKLVGLDKALSLAIAQAVSWTQ